MMLVIIACKIIQAKIAITTVVYRIAAFTLLKQIIHIIITKDIAMKKNILFLILILGCSSIVAVANDAATETEQSTEKKITTNAQKIPVVVIAAEDQDDNNDNEYVESLACPTCGAHTCPTCGASTGHVYHRHAAAYSPYYCDDFECGYPHISHYPFGW